MTRALHELIKAARQRAADNNHTLAWLAKQTGVPSSLMSKWSRRPIRAEYRPAASTDKKYYEALQTYVPRPPEGGQVPSSPEGEDRSLHSDDTAHEMPAGDASEGEAPAVIDEAGKSQAYVRPPAAETTGAGPSHEADVDAIREAARRRFRKKEQRARQKKRQTIRFSHGPACLFFCGDQHIGNAGSDVDRMYREQEIMLDTPAGYVWQMGDVVDNFIVGRLIEQNMKPSTPIWEQWELAQDYLAGFEDRLVAYCGGNHGAWTMKASGGIDYRKEVCPDGILYDGDEVQATIKVGTKTVRVWSRHKWRGSSIYNQTHGQERAARFADPAYDVYVGAHRHTGAVTREFIHEGQRKLAIQLGAYKMYDDYARAMGFPGSDGSTAAALIIHDDGSIFGMGHIERARDYMQAIY